MYSIQKANVGTAMKGSTSSPATNDSLQIHRTATGFPAQERENPVTQSRCANTASNINGQIIPFNMCGRA
jgi:hypothetical protein